MSPPNVSVAPLLIEVKAIRIDGRKMTITVFQQIPSLGLVLNASTQSPSIRTDIRPWGYVRHATKDDVDLWLVAECKGKLYRCPLRFAGAYEPRNATSTVLSEYRKRILTEYEQLFIAT